MSMEKLAQEYRRGAADIRARIDELRTRTENPRISPDERFALKQRILSLECIMGETMRTAYIIENYYGGRVRAS